MGRLLGIVSVIASVAVFAVLAILVLRGPEMTEGKPRDLSPGPSSPVRPAATADLANFGRPSTLGVILDRSLGTTKRMKAVDTLPRTQSAENLAVLRWLLRKRGENEGLRNNVACKLRDCGEEHLVSDLTEMLWDEKETPKWRNYCVQQLCCCYEEKPDPAVLDTLFKAAGADEKLVKICAVWSLALIATPRDKRKLPDEETLTRTRELALAALREEDAHFLIRTAGVQSCARLGLAEALPEIRKLAYSDDTKPMHLRIVAVAALGELTDAESIGFLEKLAKESRGQLRAAAELALKRIRQAQAPEAAPADRF